MTLRRVVNAVDCRPVSTSHETESSSHTFKSASRQTQNAAARGVRGPRRGHRRPGHPSPCRTFSPCRILPVYFFRRVEPLPDPGNVCRPTYGWSVLFHLQLVLVLLSCCVWNFGFSKKGPSAPGRLSLSLCRIFLSHVFRVFVKLSLVLRSDMLTFAFHLIFYLEFECLSILFKFFCYVHIFKIKYFLFKNKLFVTIVLPTFSVIAQHYNDIILHVDWPLSASIYKFVYYFLYFHEQFLMLFFIIEKNMKFKVFYRVYFLIKYEFKKILNLFYIYKLTIEDSLNVFNILHYTNTQTTNI